MADVSYRHQSPGKELCAGRHVDISAWQTSSLLSLGGIWTKDKDASESMEEAMDLAELSFLTKQAVRLLRGIDITLSHSSVEISVLTVVPWFKVRERYLLNGETTKQKRRDLRPGALLGRAVTTADGCLELHLSWAGPHAGHGMDTFRLKAQDELHVQSTVTVDGKTVTYTIVYKRQ